MTEETLRKPGEKKIKLPVIYIILVKSSFAYQTLLNLLVLFVGTLSS